MRDGEQTPGVVYSVADKLAIAEKLDEVGVERIEAGMPAVSDQDFEAMKAIAAEAKENPDLLHSAPHVTPVGRVDEVLPVVRGAKAIKK